MPTLHLKDLRFELRNLDLYKELPTSAERLALSNSQRLAYLQSRRCVPKIFTLSLRHVNRRGPPGPPLSRAFLRNKARANVLLDLCELVPPSQEAQPSRRTEF